MSTSFCVLPRCFSPLYISYHIAWKKKLAIPSSIRILMIMIITEWYFISKSKLKRILQTRVWFNLKAGECYMSKGQGLKTPLFGHLGITRQPLLLPLVSMVSSSDEFSLADGVSVDDWYLANIHQFGFFRINYEAENWAKLIHQLNTDHEVNAFR